MQTKQEFKMIAVVKFYADKSKAWSKGRRLFSNDLNDLIRQTKAVIEKHKLNGRTAFVGKIYIDNKQVYGLNCDGTKWIYEINPKKEIYL